MIPYSNLIPTSTKNASGAPIRTQADVDQQRTSSAGKGRFAMRMHLSQDVCISGAGNDFNSAWAGNLIRPLLPGMPTANMQYLLQREQRELNAIANNPNNIPNPSPVPFSQISSSDDDGSSTQSEKFSGTQDQQRVSITGNTRQQQNTTDSIPVVTPPPEFGDSVSSQDSDSPEVVAISSQNQLPPTQTMNDSTEKPGSVVPADPSTSSPLQIQFQASVPLTPPSGLGPSPFNNFTNNNTMFDVASLGFQGQGLSPMMFPVNFKQPSRIGGHPRKRLRRSKECPSPPVYLCQCPSPVPMIPLAQQHQQPSRPGPVCMYPFPCPCPACSSSSKPRKNVLKSHLKQANPNAKIIYASSYQEPCNAGPPQGKARKLSFVSGLKKRPRQKERGLRGFGINGRFPSTTQLRLRIPGMKSCDEYLFQPVTPCCNPSSCCPTQPIICCPRSDQQPMDSPFNQLIRPPHPRSIKTQTLGVMAGGPITIADNSSNLNRYGKLVQYSPKLAVIRVMTGITSPAKPNEPPQGSNYSLAGTTKVEAVSSNSSSINRKPRVVDKANDAFASVNDFSTGTAAVPIYSSMDKSYLAPETQSIITSMNLSNAEIQTKSMKKIKFNLTEKGHDYVSSAKSTQTIKKPPLYVFERFSTTIKSKSRIDSPEAGQPGPTGQTTGKSRQSSRTTSKAKLPTKNTKST